MPDRSRRANSSSCAPPRTPARRAAGGALVGWTSSDSAAFARASTTAFGGEGRAAGIACACVVGVELHAHREVAVCAIGRDELTAVLLLRQQRGHAAQPAPGLWNGRNGEPSRRCGPDRAGTAEIRPQRQPSPGRRAFVQCLRERSGERLEATTVEIVMASHGDADPGCRRPVGEADLVPADGTLTARWVWLRRSGSVNALDGFDRPCWLA